MSLRRWLVSSLFSSAWGKIHRGPSWALQVATSDDHYAFVIFIFSSAKASSPPLVSNHPSKPSLLGMCIGTSNGALVLAAKKKQTSRITAVSLHARFYPTKYQYPLLQVERSE
jgi:hypothetical protein